MPQKMMEIEQASMMSMKEGKSSTTMVGQVVCDAFAMGNHAILEP